MKIRELKALALLAEELHFGRAAERFGVAQPQLSELIRRIESEAGVRIFERRPRVQVTHGGQVLVETARRVLSELEAGTQRARAVAAGRSGRVCLGFSPVAMCSDLPEVLRSFAEANPNVEMNLSEAISGPLGQRLKEGILDIIISRERAQEESVESIRFARDHINLMVPSGHAAAVSVLVASQQLEDEDFAMFPRRAAPEYYDRIMGWATAAGLTLNVTREVDSWMASAALVGAGLSFSFGTALLGRIKIPGVVYRNLSADPLDVSFWMSWQKAGLSPAAARFVEHVRASRPE